MSDTPPAVASLVAAVKFGQDEFVVKGNDVRPFVSARLCGTAVTLLYDTGAVITCLRKDIYEQIKENSDPKLHIFRELKPQRMAVGANNKPLDIIAEVKMLLCMAGQQRWQNFFIVENLPVEGLIGLDAIKLFDLTYNPAVRRLLGSSESLVTAAHSVTIAPNDMEVVAVNFPLPKCPTEDYVIEGVQEASIPPTLVTTTTGQNVLVPFYNSSAEPVNIKGNTVIGHCSTAESIAPFSKVCAKVLAINEQTFDKWSLDERLRFIQETVKTDHMTKEESNELLALCKQFPRIFSMNEYDLGRCNSYTHSIQMKDNEPVFVQQFRVPEVHREKIIEHVNELLKLNVLTHSISKYSSPIFCVAKRSGALRVVTDYRMVNERSVPHYHVGQTIDECIDQIGRLNTQFMSSLDMRACFYQIPLDKDSRKITAFTVRGLGTFEYATCPMGLLSAPAACYSMMGVVLRGLPNVIVYLDDVLIVSATRSEHLQHLREVFERFKLHNLKLNLAKCSFFALSLDYLGYELTKEGLRPGKDKIAVVRDFPPPTTVKEIQSFLGLAQYFRRHIRNFSIIGQHLTQLTSKKSQWKGGQLPEQAAQAFEWFKQRLCSRPLVRYPDFKRPFILSTDAATGDAAKQIPGGLGAVLTQLDDKGVEYVVGYASRGLKSFEKNYGAYLLELQAATWGIEYYSTYLKGTRFTLRVDHKPLTTLSNVHKKTLNNLQLLMLTYDFILEYRAGKDNVLPDFCSRHPHLDPDDDKKRIVTAIEIPAPSYTDVFNYSVSDLFKLQENDPDCKALRDFIKTKKLADVDNKHLIVTLAKNAILNEHSLVFVVEKNSDGSPAPKLFVPRAIQREFIRAAHCGTMGGHSGITASVARLRESCYWPSLMNDVRNFIMYCKTCQHARSHLKKTPAPLGELDLVDQPWVRVHLDLFGPLQGPGPNRFILLCTDAFSKYAEIVPIKNKTAEVVAEAFWSRWICRFGVPIQLISDRGLEFCNSIINRLSTRLGIDKRMTSGFHPRSNGMVEIKNKSLARYIRSTIEESTLFWEDLLPAVAFSYNTATSAAIQTTPFKALYGVDPRYPFHDATGLERNLLGDGGFGDELYLRIERVRRHAEKHNMSFRDSYTINFNKDKSPLDFKVGQKVLLHSPSMALRGLSEKKTNYKFIRPWCGPYKIHEVHGNNNVTLLLPHKKDNSKYLRVHMDRVKLYYEEEEGHAPPSPPPDAVHSRPENNELPSLRNNVDTLPKQPRQPNDSLRHLNKKGSTAKVHVDDDSDSEAYAEGSRSSTPTPSDAADDPESNDEHPSPAASAGEHSEDDDESDGGGGGGAAAAGPSTAQSALQSARKKLVEKVKQVFSPRREDAAAAPPLEEDENEPDPDLDQANAGSAWNPQGWAEQPFATTGRQLRRRNKRGGGANDELHLAPGNVSAGIHRKPRSDRGKKRGPRNPDDQQPKQ